MPEVTASTKIVLGSIAAAAALITGLLANVLAANISAFFSGTPAKTGKRPAILWLAFFVSASLSVVAGSITTFAPTAAVTPSAGTPHPRVPKIVVTNLNGSVQYRDDRNFIIVCRDIVELANTSDVPTSVVAVGTELQMDNMVVKLAPTEYGSRKYTDEVQVALSPWKAPPQSRDYLKIKNLDQFQALQGETLPIRINARSTVPVYADYALKFVTGLPQKIAAVHVVRFPDIEDIQTDEMQCR